MAPVPSDRPAHRRRQVTKRVTKSKGANVMTPRVFLTTAIAGAALVFAVPAFAEANPSASCNGIGVSAHAGEPGAIAAITLEIHALVKSLGFPPGIVDSTFAKLHDGSVEACFPS